jgi:chorismate mutase
MMLQRTMTDTLEQLRAEIDAADAKILDALAERMAVVQRVGKFKKANNLPPLDPKRWEQVLQSKLVQAGEKGLSADLIKDIYERIHKESLEIEEKT